MSHRQRSVSVLTCFLLALFTSWWASAQGGSCPDIVQKALDAVGNNCSQLNRNSACYGYDQVAATFAKAQPPDFFTKPADRADLLDLQTIRTAALDTSNQRWGVALMNVQANVPNSIPGQAVTFLLLGDAEVTNAVKPAEAFTPAQPVNITVQARTDPHSSPTLDSNTLGTVDAGTQLPADGLSADASWVRVAFNGAPAWVSRGVLNAADPVNSLPIISEQSRTPMQAFYFKTGIGKPECAQAPSTLAVRSPKGIKVDLSVNGADIQIGSLVTFATLPDRRLRLTVIAGGVETADGRTIRQGETITALIDADGNIISWEDTRPATPEELQEGTQVQIIMDAATGGGSVTNPPTSDCQGPITHVVQPGENLFRIALRYNTSVQDIASASGISNLRVIFVGQKLTIPHPCSGFVNAPGAPVNPVGGGSTTATGQGTQCAKPTSPTGQMPYDGFYFYWDPFPGATNYRINIYDSSGGLRKTDLTPDNTTNLRIPTNEDAIGLGNDFAWDVSAIINGQIVCTSARVPVTRASKPTTPQPPAPTFSASWACSAPFTMTVNFFNVPAGNTVTVSFNSTSPTVPPSPATFSVPPFSQTFSSSPFTFPTVFSSGVVTTSSGQSVNLPGSLSC